MESCRGTLIFICCLFLLVLLIGGQSTIHPQLKENCSYTITIETTCTKGAETSSHVSLRFGDGKTKDIIVKHLNTKHVRQLDPLQPQLMPRKPFQACMVDQFQVKAKCVLSPICYLYLKLVGKDDWRPGFAQVSVSQSSRHLNSNYFYFRRYLPRHVWHGDDVCDKEITPFGIKYMRKVL